MTCGKSSLCLLQYILQDKPVLVALSCTAFGGKIEVHSPPGKKISGYGPAALLLSYAFPISPHQRHLSAMAAIRQVVRTFHTCIHATETIHTERSDIVPTKATVGWRHGGGVNATKPR